MDQRRRGGKPDLQGTRVDRGPYYVWEEDRRAALEWAGELDAALRTHRRHGRPRLGPNPARGSVPPIR